MCAGMFAVVCVYVCVFLCMYNCVIVHDDVIEVDVASLCAGKT